MGKRDALSAIAERLKAHAVTLRLTDEYHARIQWANESSSVYLSFPGCKIRIADHGAAYPCDLSVDPQGVTEAQAMVWLTNMGSSQIEEEESLAAIAAMSDEEVRQALRR